MSQSYSSISSFHYCLARQQAGTSCFRDLLLSKLREIFRLHNHRHINLAISKKLEVSLRNKINHRGLATGGTLCCFVDTLSSNIEQLVNVECGGEGPVLQLVELTHTNLTEVTRVIFIEEDAVMVLSSSVTSATGVLSVLADTTMSHGHVAALFACFVEAGRHVG